MRMLIDARHREETRVAVVNGSRIEELDFESAEHKQIKGNIYLAKVTRVEPSLQAAFIDYGGNRHGFLAFSEIHPDYYQIPKADRDALLREEAEHAAEEERLRTLEDARHDDPDDDFLHSDDDDEQFEGEAESVEDIGAVEEIGAPGLDDDHQDDMPAAQPESSDAPEENAADELRKKRHALRRRYKIQDVIHRRQVLLVQVVKEERGNKGAALTTYLSLAGRYCVLMPNTSSGGGISRKISNGADRKRLKTIMADLNLPQTMGCIVRTAGLSRTKTEIKRDFDYLARLWDEIREKTLASSAPALIYGDSDLIKRAIRDIYNRDIDEVIVEGEEGFRAARTFMKLLMPSHARKIAMYQDSVPLFQRYGVEDQLSAMYQPLVQLKSGGYLVINPTEALVSIDINSGRSTREHNIEQTAYATNIEAAHEIARQLRLRDMAGLVVIDFIDMESNGHIRKVERAMKDALRNDRARIQVGRISGFGLMEMSRQRLRTGVLEASTRPCARCEGTGLMRTASSAGLSALRMLEDEAARGRGDRICLRAGREAAVYVLNRKRAELAEIEARYGVSVEVLIDESLEGARMSAESGGNRPIAPLLAPAPIIDLEEDDEELPIDEEEDEEEDRVEGREDGPDTERQERPERARSNRDDDDSEAGGKRRRRRRSRGGRRDEPEAATRETGVDDEGEDGEIALAGADASEGGGRELARSDEGPGGARRRRGRRGRRGGRGRNGEGSDRLAETGGNDAQLLATEELLPSEIDVGIDAIAPVEDVVDRVEREAQDAAPAPEPEAEAALEEERPKTRRRPRARKPEAAEAAPQADAEVAAPVKPKRTRRKVAAPAEDPMAAEAAAQSPVPVAVAEPKAANDRNGAEKSAAETALSEAGENGDKQRSGWWQRTFG